MRCSLSKGERFLLVLLLPFFATPALKRYSLSLSRSLSLSNQRDCGSSVCATTVSSPMKTRWDDRHFFDDTKANSFLLLVFIYIKWERIFKLFSNVESEIEGNFLFFLSLLSFFKQNSAQKLRSETAETSSTLVSYPGWRNID